MNGRGMSLSARWVLPPLLRAGRSLAASPYQCRRVTAAMAVDARHQHLLVTNVGAMDSAGNPLGPGRVSVLDTRSGVVLRTVPVGLAPGDVAVDERAGRALVLNLGGTVHVTDAWRWLPSWLRRLPFVPRQAPAAPTGGGAGTVLDTTR